MSRRKQARPRHVEDPDLDSPAIASNSVVPVFQEENGIVDDKVDTLEEKDNISQLTETEDLEPLPDKPMSVEAHVCQKCCIEFCDVNQYKLHKLECDEPMDLLHKNSENTGTSPMDLCKVNGMLGTRLSTDDKDMENFDDRSDVRPDTDEQYEEGNQGEDEVDAGVGGGEEFENQSDVDNIEQEYNKPLDETDDNDLDSIKEGGSEDPMKPETNPDLPAYVQTLSTLLSGVTGNSNSNVMLEPLQATKAAVAQFAENNLPGKEQDVNKLQTTLYNLQQQQIMQLQLIHQLQLQLVAGGVQTGQLPVALLNGQLPLGPNFAGLNLSSALADLKSKAAAASKTSSRSNSPDPEMDSDYEDQHSPKDLEMKGSRPTTPSHSREMLSTPTSEGMADLLKPSPTFTMPPSLSASDAKSGSFSTPTSLPSSSVLDYSRSSTVKSEAESPRYVNNDDPFFKHKCRICNKVFGSDSALQIHYRSHTGPPHKNNALFVDLSLKLGAVLSTSDVWTWEKPFQCNICGGRFSTRGNLKVHFQRHKAEFPNVEMNPNPVPEHLDKAPMPLIGSPFPPSMGPFASPAFMGMQNLMNGFMFPPPHLTPRPPMSSPMMHQQHRHQEERRASRSPSRDKPIELKKEPSPIRPASEALQRRSPDMKDMKISPSHLPASVHMNMSKSSPVQTSIPLVSNYPVMSRLPSQPPYSQHHRTPVITPTSMAKNDQFRTTILPSSILDNDDNLEQFMEIDKSETSKLQQLVDNIEHKLTDPNQCVICHRVLSCKSALQMHYRIHTGERPFRCKICGRSFTTKGNLKTHMGVHRAKPPLRMMHQCPVCHKQFTNLLVLQQHIRSHTEMSGLPMHGMGGPMHMYGHMGFEHHHGPLNMKRHYPEDFEKELDLSKKPRLSDSDDKMKLINANDEKAESVNDDDDEDFVDQNEMDDEANKLAAEDAIKEGLARENSEERSSPDNSNDAVPNKLDSKEDLHQPPKNGLDFSGSIQGSSSPKYLQEDSNPSQDGTFNSYSTSLAALEERVRQIDSTMARNPLSQFHAAPFLLAPAYSGERALSPTSESDSDIGKDRLKPATPALSTSSDGSMGGNFMIGAMDVRSSDVNGKTTMCNICYKTFACRSALDIHYRSHTKERPYKCDLCDKSFTTRGNMRQHLLTHKINEDGSERTDLENNNNNSCTPNQNDTDDESEKSNDSSRFNESLSDKCKQESGVSQGSVKKEDVSPSEKSSNHNTPLSMPTNTPATPRHSSSSYTSSENQSPFVSKNPTVKHQCLVCQKGFSSASALQIHIRTHTGDKPFKCTVCGKAFTTKGNLKVHMGTHMWNNSPSRRGRRMSIEPPFMMAHKENPYLPHGFAPRPDFYPFQFPPFMNGLPGHHKSLSEMALMQNISNGIGLKPDLTSPRNDIIRPKSETSPMRDDKPKFAESGELDLSMKSTNSSGSRSSEKTSPSSVDSNSSSGMVSPPHMSLGWGWKASCHFCSRTFPTTATLEHHVRSMHMMGDSLPKVGAS